MLLGLILLVVGIAWTRLGGEETPVQKAKIENEITEQVSDISHLRMETIDLGEVSESLFKEVKKPFDVFWSSDERNKHYGFFQEDQQNKLILIPTSTKYEVEIEELKITHKTIEVKYSYGSPKIPRLVGQVSKVPIKAYTFDFKDVDSAVYELKLINELDESLQEEVLDFTKPFYRDKWELSGLTWGKEGQLIFGGNLDGKWDLWSAQIEENAQPKKMTTRHEELPLNTLATLGGLNLNIPKPEYNERRDRVVYHAEQDIFEVTSQGTKNYPLTIKPTQIPESDGLSHFDNDPQWSPSGDYIFFKRIYDPMTSELWRMNHDGSNIVKIPLPQLGFLEEFDISPKGDQIAVLLSNREADIMNGRSNLWVIPLKDGGEIDNSVKPRRITTVGYKVSDVMFRSDNKKIVLSMKEQSTTSDSSTDVWSVNSNNTDLTRLTPQDGLMDTSPVWSPNGKKIAFLSGEGEKRNLWMMNKDGSDRKSLSPLVEVVGEPLWSPDSSKVYVADIRGNIFEFEISTGEIFRVVKGY